MIVFDFAVYYLRVVALEVHRHNDLDNVLCMVVKHTMKSLLFTGQLTFHKFYFGSDEP